MPRVRRNPLMSRPKAHAGRSARFKSWEGGFHTGREDQVYAYAQQKWESASDGDVPVILALDMSGLRPRADIDSRRACVMAFDGVYPKPRGELTRTRAEEIAKAWSEPDFHDGYMPNVHEDVTGALFGLTSPSTATAVWSMLTDLEADDVVVMWRVCRELQMMGENAVLPEEEDRKLIQVFGQAAYFDEEIDDSRVLGVRYMAPFFRYVCPEDPADDGDEEAVQIAEDAGFSILTDMDQEPRPRLKRVMGYDEFDNVEYHGTVLTNLLAACPDFLSKLPEPSDFNIPGAKSLKVLAKRAQALREGGLVELIDDVDEEKNT